MKTEIFSFNEIDMDGNQTQVLILVTGQNFDYNSTLDHIEMLKRKSKDSDPEHLVDETYKWLESKGNRCEYLAFTEIKF